MNRRELIDEWVSTLARVVGLVGLIAFSVKWMLTGQIEPTLVAASGGLYGLGKAGEAIATLRRAPPMESPSTPEPKSGP